MPALLDCSVHREKLLHGNYEVIMVEMLVASVSHRRVLDLTATMDNNLRGVTNVILGRFCPLRKTSRWQEKATGWLKRYGAATLLVRWMLFSGDWLCLLSGWMRIPWGRTILFLCLGKALRYVALAAAAVQGM
ncbi:hypothetical protein AGQ52_24730, partial [Salmonella enterica subsp. enterica]